MEAHSQADNSPDPNQVLEGQLREIYGRVVYSHKTHEKCADILLSRLSNIKWCQIILSALSASGYVSTLLGAGAAGSIVGSTFSVLLLALNLYTKDHDLSEVASKHKRAANDIWLIREKYLSLIADLVIGRKPLEVLQQERDALAKDLHAVYSTAPSTNSRAYAKAQKALKHNEEMTFSDEEVDAFLPAQLRKNDHSVYEAAHTRPGVNEPQHRI